MDDSGLTQDVNENTLTPVGDGLAKVRGENELTRSQALLKQWVGKGGDRMFWVTVGLAAAGVVLLIGLLAATKSMPAYLAGLGLLAALVSTEGATLRFVSHDRAELKPADRLGKALAFVVAGIGIVGGAVGLFAALQTA